MNKKPFCLALSFCSKDLIHAIKLVRWITVITNPKTLKQTNLILCFPKETTIPEPLFNILTESLLKFNTVWVHAVTVLHNEWPKAPTEQFGHCLDKAEGTDMLFLEPDAVPVCPEWIDRIQAEWESRKEGCEFMGDYVSIQDTRPHMSGIAVYGAGWKNIVPELKDFKESGAWDYDHGPKVLQNYHRSNTIMHRWGGRDSIKGHTLAISSIKDIGSACLFHQDKAHVVVEWVCRKYGISVNSITLPECTPITYKVNALGIAYIKVKNRLPSPIVDNRPFLGRLSVISPKTWEQFEILENLSGCLKMERRHQDLPLAEALAAFD